MFLFISFQISPSPHPPPLGLTGTLFWGTRGACQISIRLHCTPAHFPYPTFVHTAVAAAVTRSVLETLASNKRVEACGKIVTSRNIL